MEDENTYEKKPYKINKGDIIKVNRIEVDWKGQELTFFKTYFKIGGEQYYKSLRFKRGEIIKDGQTIRILDFFETPRHIDKFRDEWTLMILEYENVDDYNEAVQDYREQVKENTYEIDDDDILF